MPISEQYQEQVQLLVRLIPLVAKEDVFALKGGTAINLFVRDLPRLSVDIDLTYVPVEERAVSLTTIDDAMRRIAERAERRIRGAKSNLAPLRGEGTITKCVIQVAVTQVKIEVTPVLRGSAYEPELRAVSPRVEDAFGFAEMKVVSFADLYAGKSVASLDRQHPRDLFDMRDLLANEGVTNELREAFIVYLLGHNRGFHEVLDPSRLDIEREFERGFVGMTTEDVSLEALYETREQVIDALVGQMPARHRKLLLTFMEGAPDWSLLNIPHASELPAIRWRQANLEKLEPARRAELLQKLSDIF